MKIECTIEELKQLIKDMEFKEKNKKPVGVTTDFKIGINSELLTAEDVQKIIDGTYKKATNEI